MGVLALAFGFLGMALIAWARHWLRAAGGALILLTSLLLLLQLLGIA